MKRLSLLHYIKTDKAEYQIFEIDFDPKKDLVRVGVERIKNTLLGKYSVRILEPQIFDESWGLMGGDSFSSFVMSCINHVRSYCKDNDEIIIEDLKIDNNGK